MSDFLGDLVVSLSNHEVGHTDFATPSSFDKLRMRSTECSRWRGEF